MTILDTIVEHKKTEILTLPDVSHPPLCTCNFSGFSAARPVLIAEIKAASPSEGDIVTDFKPEEIVRDYIQGGVDAISILTDTRFFKGSFEVLQSVRKLTDRPLLCKDFIISDRQVRHARQCGADLCLLIVKILDPDQLRHLKTSIEDLGMKAVVEVQAKDELAVALTVNPEILLINNRNLSSFEVDTNTTNDLLAMIPDHIQVIAASGIQEAGQLATFLPRVDGFLIGTALMRSSGKERFLKDARIFREKIIQDSNSISSLAG